MANGSIAQAINPHTLGQAIAYARQACANDQRWLNAVNRAVGELTVPGWQFDGETLRMPSASNPGRKYTVTDHSCDCPAGKKGVPCKHRAARRLLIRAAEIARQAQRPRYTAADHTRIQKESAELFV